MTFFSMSCIYNCSQHPILDSTIKHLKENACDTRKCKWYSLTVWPGRQYVTAMLTCGPPLTQRLQPGTCRHAYEMATSGPHDL